LISKLFSVGDRVKPGRYYKHSQFSRVVNYTDGDLLVALVNADVGAGPNNIVVSADRFLESSESLIVSEDKLAFDHEGFELELIPKYDSRFFCINEKAKTLDSVCEDIEELIFHYSSPLSLAFLLDPEREVNFRTNFEKQLVSKLKASWDLFLRGKINEAVVTAKGTGLGLTPSGDDFLSGILSGLRIGQLYYQKSLNKFCDEIYQEAIGTNIFSNTFLFYAKNGCFYESVKLMLQHLFVGSTISPELVEKVFSRGETSGADYIVGLWLGAARLCVTGENDARNV